MLLADGFMVDARQCWNVPGFDSESKEPLAESHTLWSEAVLARVAKALAQGRVSIAHLLQSIFSW